jgi:hypothetical protein
MSADIPDMASPASDARANSVAEAAPSTPDKNSLRFIDEFLKYVYRRGVQCERAALAYNAFARDPRWRVIVCEVSSNDVWPEACVQTIGGGKGGACVMPACKAATGTEGASCARVTLSTCDVSGSAPQWLPQP